jgi:hypothetical protein
MAVRTFDPEELVRLPRMTTTDTIALGTALVTRADSIPNLPPPIARAHGRLRQSLDALCEGEETRVQEQGQGDSKGTANRALDASWAGMRWWCKGWTLLPYPEYTSQAEAGRKLEAVLFPDGLRFTQFPFRDQWVESQSRLGLIEKEALEAVIATLGGQPILDAVRKAHADFGLAMGFTDATDEPPSSLLVREGRDELKAAMRRYVLQVTAHADPDDPASGDLADALLLPIKTWKTRTPAPVDADETSENTPPDGSPAAGTPPTPAG